jgi:hypothetical protein
MKKENLEKGVIKFCCGGIKISGECAVVICIRRKHEDDIYDVMNETR